MPNFMAEAHFTKDVGCELRSVVASKGFGKPEMLKIGGLSGLYSSVSCSSA